MSHKKKRICVRIQGLVFLTIHWIVFRQSVTIGLCNYVCRFVLLLHGHSDSQNQKGTRTVSNIKINQLSIYLIVDDDVQRASDWKVGKLGHLQSLLVHALADHGGITVNLYEKKAINSYLTRNLRWAVEAVGVGCYRFFKSRCATLLYWSTDLHANGVAPDDLSVCPVVGRSGGHVAGPAHMKTVVDW